MESTQITEETALRRLGHIEKVSGLNPIYIKSKDGQPELAQAIELAEILGWKVIVKKGEFKVGDLCVYCEIDSILPDKPEFAFLKDKGFRIKTLKIRGEISQGITFPLSILDGFLKPEDFKIEEGADVTNILGIKKYELPNELIGKAKGVFPTFIRKTEEERIQNMIYILNNHNDLEYYVTEKLDGTSVSYYYKDKKYGVCSRNLELLGDDGNDFWKVGEELDIEGKLKKYDKNICIQGEIIGEKIQKNQYGLKGKTIYFFSAFDIDKAEYLELDDFEGLIKQLGLKMVPIVDRAYKLPDNIDKLLKYADGKSMLNAKAIREGVVIRNKKHVPFRISFKVISNQYLLKNE